MRLMLSFASLFASVMLLQLSSGGVGPLDALTGLAAGFGTAQVGVLGSAHFLGFFIGCWWAPRLMGSVGHARTYAAFTALGAIGLAAHVLVTNPAWWALFRLASGLCVAGCYTVIEAWLQAKVTNQTRGRAMGSYRVVDIVASLGAQFMIGTLASVPTYIAYNLLTIVCCASLLPLAISRAEQPATALAPRLRPALSWRISPLATLGVMVAGLSSASFRMVGPIYGQAVGLRPDQIGTFLAIYVAGGGLAQYPVGWLADKFDRRWVLIGLSVASIGTSLATIGAAQMGPLAILVAAGLVGLSTYPIYSISAAHAHDFAEDDARVELSAALMFFYALGAIAAPWGTSVLIQHFGPPALFVVLAAAHLGLVIFGFARMRARPSPAERMGYVYVPRTSFIVGRLLRRGRGAAGDS
ncbi:MAG: MFS transporter [Limimaricola sp.]|uniref:MFS transporter n=1 Tax=Limimaricola sp. TaxID=2211665 RepID=UPI001D2AC689|nr:MFS transporter [Limimaricola sp.]MBI1416259.1 MFS transporter [Limimaricola sp.]